MTFGEKLRACRKQTGMSQEQLAAHLSVSRQAVSKWETENALPDIENIIQISTLLGISIDELLKDNKQSSKENQPLIIMTQKQRDYPAILGIVCISFSILSIFIIWLLAKIHFGNAAAGFVNFIWIYGLDNFLLLLCFIFIVGIVLVLHKKTDRQEQPPTTKEK